MEHAAPQILDTTLRDGSYAIDFQFSTTDTALIASALESAGIGLIEVAHGLGVGAARAGRGNQADTDEAYMRAAVNALHAARAGVFFIPDIGCEDDMRLAADCGIGFVRIGTNITELPAAEPYAALAKSLGLTISCNLMKSYALAPEEFAGRAAMAEGLGADIVCLVDSAGTMLPEDVRRYIEAARAFSTVTLGFHGHDNLSLAVANTLAAYEAGATVLDTSLQGIGRSEGNAVTEVLVAILQKRGLLENTDLNGLLDVAEAFIRPMMHHRRRSGIGITAGRARFHSSFLGKAMQAAARHGVDVREVMVRAGALDPVNASEETLEQIAAEIATEESRPPIRIDIAGVTAAIPQAFEETVTVRARELKEMSCKLGKKSVLNIVVTSYEMTHVSPFVETSYGCVMTNIMLADPALLRPVFERVDHLVDYVLLDPGKATVPQDALTKACLLTYSDHEMWARAAVSQLTHLLGMPLNGRCLAITGVPQLVARVSMTLAELGTTVLLDASLQLDGIAAGDLFGTIISTPLEQAIARADAVVALSPRRPAIDAGLVDRMRPGSTLYDGGIGSLERNATPQAERRNIRVVRVDMRPSLAATAVEMIGMKEVVDRHMGRDTWDGATVVAGGLIGHEGDIVVDSISRPSRVIGIADGKGGILSADHRDDDVRKVRKAILRKRLEAKGD